jgi:NADH-quinone oxidoreductase subunit N
VVNFLRVSFFDRTLLPLYANHQAQTYFSISLYLFVAILLCGILAVLAYLFSLSSAQDGEKRSEYECGFEPFDNATRLPFDVHFYLVGILFLIFDVEIALLFPWVLGLRTISWFGFYLMLGFILILAVGFLYEWKRGALIWPSRQQEALYTHVGSKNVVTLQAGIYATLPPLTSIKQWNMMITVKAHAKLTKRLENYLIQRDFIIRKAVLDTVESYLTTLKFIRNTVLTAVKLLTPFRALAESFQRSVRTPALSATVILPTRARMPNIAHLYRLINKIVTQGRLLYNRFENDDCVEKTNVRYLARTEIERITSRKRTLNRIFRQCSIRLNALKTRRGYKFKKLKLTLELTKHILAGVRNVMIQAKRFRRLDRRKYRSQSRRHIVTAVKSDINFYLASHNLTKLQQANKKKDLPSAIYRCKKAALSCVTAHTIKTLYLWHRYGLKQYRFFQQTKRKRWHQKNKDRKVTAFYAAKNTLRSSRRTRRRAYRIRANKVKDATQRLQKYNKPKGRLQLSIIAPPLFVWEKGSYADNFFSSFLPELSLTAVLIVILFILSIELGRKQSKKALALNSLTALQYGLFFLSAMYAFDLFFSGSALIFGGYFSITLYTSLLKLMTVLSVLFILTSSRSYVQIHNRHLLEYPFMLVLALLFILLLIGANHIVASFVALVGFSLNVYVLILFDVTNKTAREAGIKYFYLSALSSGLILYSIFLLFVAVGTGNFYEINFILINHTELVITARELLHFGFIILLTGLFFKLSAFPGNLWAADIYEGSPDPIMSFFMLPSKIAVLAFTLRLLTTAFDSFIPLWQPLVATSAGVSLVWGCITALAERKTKRFIAYASINQIGFLLLGLASASFSGYTATLLYLVIYVITNVIFLSVFLHAKRQDGSALIYLTDFRGLGMRYPTYRWMLAIAVLSIAGIPPLAGFFGKYYLLLHAQEQGLYGLVILGLATSLCSTYYYLKLIKILWFEGMERILLVNCNITIVQQGLIRVSEFLLWTFPLYAVLLTILLDAAVESLFTLPGESTSVDATLVSYTNPSQHYPV